MQMKKYIQSGIVVPLVLAVIGFYHAPLLAAEKKDATTNSKSAQETEAAYTESIEKRVAEILEVLELKDSAKKTKIHDLLVAHYRSLRDWHDTNDPRLKSATEQQAQEIKGSLKTIHDRFINALSAELTPEQVEAIKDKMTYGTVKVTYDAYCEIVPNLTATEKEKILELLKQGREEAMDGGSHQEKAAIFKRYKGKINNYLDSQGHNVKQAYKDWGEKQKAKSIGRTSGTEKKENPTP
jgi:gas vesicle protein